MSSKPFYFSASAFKALFLASSALAINTACDSAPAPPPSAPPLQLQPLKDTRIGALADAKKQKSPTLAKEPTVAVWMPTSENGIGQPTIGPSSPQLSILPMKTQVWRLPFSPQKWVWTHPLSAKEAQNFTLSVESRNGLKWPAEVQYVQKSASLVQASLLLLEPLPTGDALSLVAQNSSGTWRIPLHIIAGQDERPPWKRAPAKRRKRRRGKRRR